jgi:hypothetical protein
MGLRSALDLDTVVQATQHLSSKLKLTDLLVSLMDLIVANTGASKVRPRRLVSLGRATFTTSLCWVMMCLAGCVAVDPRSARGLQLQLQHPQQRGFRSRQLAEALHPSQGSHLALHGSFPWSLNS